MRRKIDYAMIGIIITIILQTATIAYWAGSVSARIESLSLQIELIRGDLKPRGVGL
jgi:hypothetical protein